MERLLNDFFQQDVLIVAPALIGKSLILNTSINKKTFIIEEVEAYRGEEDLACHASKGRTKRTEIMYHAGGHIYMYLIYGMYWMLNIVTEKENIPQALLIRGISGYDGPGKLTNALNIDKSFYGENLEISNRIWIEKNIEKVKFKTTPRIGIDYAGEPWKSKLWRFVLDKT